MSQPPPVPPDPFAPPAPYGYRPPVDPYFAARPKRSNAALASMIFGLMLPFLPVVSGLIALLLGAIGMAKTKNNHLAGRKFAVAGLLLGVVNIGLGAVMIWLIVLAVGREKAGNHANAASVNLRQIGRAIALYQLNNRGQYPVSLDDLVAGDVVAADILRSPTTGTGGATFPAPYGGTDFVYARPANRLSDVPQAATMPIAYESPAHFAGTRAPVLFADGHMEIVFPPRIAGFVQIVDAHARETGAK